MKYTIQDVHRLIEQGVQKMGFFAYKDLETEEIDLQINATIANLVNGILDKSFGRALKINEEQGFQKDQVTLDNLRALHVGNALMTLNSADVDQVAFTLPNNYLHYIKATVTLSYECYDNGVKKTETKKVDVRISPSQYDLRNNPLYKTGIDSPLGEIIGSGVFIFKDSTFNITEARLTYIREPATVKYAKDIDGNYDSINSVQIDLDASLHQMIVDMTVIKISTILENPQQKIINMERNIS